MGIQSLPGGRNQATIISKSPLIQKTALHLVLFHFLLASWPENLLATLDLVASQLRVNWIGDSMFEHLQHTDQLVQQICSTSINVGSPFTFLLQVFEELHLLAIL